jgi:hypothetical protein
MNKRFDDVARNAFDFLERSIEELEQHPKHSVIHFYTAIELFVKARLLKEHWSLIVAKPDQADKTKFQRGDFQSVGLTEANDRLMKVAEDGLLDEEMKCFDGLRKERNKMVHFAHAAQGEGEEARKEMTRIIADHARGWLHLRRLLTGRWAKYFEAYAKTIRMMDVRMREQTKALESKFLLLTDEIAAAEAEGRHFVDCPSCDFKSFEVGQSAWIGEGACLTCGYLSVVVSLECVNEECGKPFLLDAAYDRCPHCDEKYPPSQIAKFIEAEKLILSCWPPDGDPPVWANCGDCESYEAVAHLKTEEWFCTECFTIFDESEIGNCEWCGSPSSALLEDSMVNGCSQCGGHAGHMADKDD